MQDSTSNPAAAQTAVNLPEALVELLGATPLPHDGVGVGILERIGAEIERRVAERTASLMTANASLSDRIAGYEATESLLRAQEADVRRIINGIPALVLLLSRAGSVRHANTRVLDHFGLSADRLRAASARDLLHPQDVQRAIRVLAGSRAAPEPFELELRLRRADGVYPWFQARAQPLTTAAGRIESWCVVLIDIDDRRRGEDALRVRELGVRLLVESLHSIPALAIISNEYGEIVYANQQVLDYYGRTLEDVKRWPTSVHIVHPDDLDRANQVVADALAAGAAVNDEYRLRRRDGVYRWFEGRYSPVRDAEGRIVNWFVILIDIDERKRSEEELRRSAAFLAEGQRLSATGTFHWQLETDALVWSEQLYGIFGVEPGVPATLDLFRSRVHPDDLALADETLARVRQTGGAIEAEHRLQLPSGAVKRVRLVAHPVPDRPGREYVGAVQDVTASWLAEEALGQVRSELARVGRAMSLGALSASIAHEINQPLAGIVTNARLGLRLLEAESPDLGGARAAAQRLHRDASRAAQVVARLRALFSNHPPAADPVDLTAASREVLSLNASELARVGVRVRTDFRAGPGAVLGDKVQLQQVILNLVLNATDALRPVVDRPRELVISSGDGPDGAVRLSVADNGVGIDPDQAEQLFSAFHTTKPGGMGMGLAVSRSIIAAHGGRLWAEANEGPGATFTFELPARTAP